MALADLLKIPPVQTYLMDGSVMTVFEAILEKFALSKNRAEELLDLTDAVLDGTLELKDIPAMLAQAFGIEEERSIRVACDVVGFRLLPLEQYVPGIVDQMKAWGADMNKYPKSRVGKSKILPETFAAQLDEKLGLDFSEVLIKRAGFLIGAYWNGERTKDSTLTFFSRATTIGGLGLQPEQSQKLLVAIDRARDLIDLVPVMAGEDPALPQDSGVVAVKEIEKEFHIGEELEETSEPVLGADITELEIAPSHEVAAEVPVVSAPEVSVPVAKKIEPKSDAWHAELREAAKKAQQMVNVSPPEHGSTDANDRVTNSAVESTRELLQRLGIPEPVFQDITLKAVKGIRDLYQTRDVLNRDLKVQGADLEQLTEAIETARKAVMLRVPSDSQASVVSGKKEENIQAPDNTLDKRFAALAKDAPKEHIEPVLASARVSLARSLEEERSGQESGVSKEKLIEAEIASRPVPVKPMLTVGSVSPKEREGVVTDIRPVKRLIGPIDELGSMSPTEFRRLSTVPEDAAQKIQDILATLESQSYEDRVKGVMAWRKSPMNQLYVLMTTTALAQGVAVAEIAAKRRASGEESLSPAEIRAVSMLNQQLRF